MERYGYDVAQICLNGHLINHSAKNYPQHNKKFCEKCGAETITACRDCNREIRGIYRATGAIRVSHKPNMIPAFCHDCGKPYPWTISKVEAAKKLAQEVEELSANEKRILIESIDDIVRDTPSASLSTIRFKKILSKTKESVWEAFREILIHIAFEAAKRKLWP